MNNGFCCLNINNIIGFLRKGGAQPPIRRVKIVTFVMNELFVSKGLILNIFRRVYKISKSGC
jgi:hypothetical protein